MTILLLAVAAVALCVIMATAWLVQRRSANGGWADVFWSYGTGLVGGALALVPIDAHGLSARQIIVAALAALWGIRLGSHIAARTMSGPEDARYAKFRSDWGDGFQARLFWFLQIQALAAIPLAASILVAARNPAPGLHVTDLIGIAIMATAILGEALADEQLRRFRHDPAHRGRICDQGLWSLSRHPNYFFEWLGWVAYATIAVPGWGQAYPWGWLALIGPVEMYWLLVQVSGIPPLEAHMLASKGNAFRAYQRRTRAFLPLPRFASRENEP